jgi:hypothetical protein
MNNIFDPEKYIGNYVVVKDGHVIYKGDDWNVALSENARTGYLDSSIMFWNNTFERESGKPFVRSGMYRKWEFDLPFTVDVDKLGYQISPYIE